jgi:DNA-binding MarR family transcriptional regulator
LLNRLPSRKGPERAVARKARRQPLQLGVLNEHLGYFVRRLQVWVFQDFMGALAAEGVRPAQYSALVVIEANPGMPQSDIADFLGIERARFARLLDRLDKRGYTERRPSPHDRRSHALYLTREGQRALKRIKAAAARHEAKLTERLGAEKRKLLLELLRDLGR